MHLPAGKRHTRLRVGESLRLTPPPRLGETALAPVLLAVDLGAGQIPLLVAEDRVPFHPAAEQPGMPVLVEAGDGMEHARRAEAASRPGPQIRQPDVETGVVTEIHPHAFAVAAEDVAGRCAEPIGIGSGHRMRGGAQETPGMGGQAERRPVRAGPSRVVRTVDPAQGDDDAAGSGWVKRQK